MQRKMSKNYKLKLKNATQPKNETFFQAKVVKIWSFGLQSLWPIPSAVRRGLKTVPSPAYQNNVVKSTCSTNFRGPSCQGLLFSWFFFKFVNFYFGLNTQNGVFGPKGVQKISSNKKIWWSLRLVTFLLL